MHLPLNHHSLPLTKLESCLGRAFGGLNSTPSFNPSSSSLPPPAISLSLSPAPHPDMAMAVTRALLLMLAAFIAVGPASAQVHHVVGGDRGWDPSSNISDWSSSRFFRVGDKIWFTYSAASEGVLELGSGDEYESCDVSNPIRMYTDGLVQVNLDTEGSRYFTSNRLESCKNGLKLHVHVQPQANADSQATAAATSATPVTVHQLAAAPTTPSGSSAVQFSSMMWPGLVLAWLMAFGKFCK